MYTPNKAGWIARQNLNGDAQHTENISSYFINHEMGIVYNNSLLCFEASMKCHNKQIHNIYVIYDTMLHTSTLKENNVKGKIESSRV